MCEESLEEEQTASLYLVESEGVQPEDSADSRSEVEFSMGNIYGREPREKLAEATLADDSLAVTRALADKTSEGYYWVDGLLFRTRLDTIGYYLEQLCLPVQYRAKCLKLAHEEFSHSGRNGMSENIKR